MLLSIMSMAGMVSCNGEYDTDSLGAGFAPLNSQVRNYTHQVYVEYSTDHVRVWGPCTDQVRVETQDLHVRMECLADSLVIIAYGYPASKNRDLDCTLAIHSDHDYALYLSGLALANHSYPVIDFTGRATCYMVLPAKTRNEFTTHGHIASDAAAACIHAEGPIVLGGTGRLAVRQLATEAGGRAIHAIEAQSFLCQYNVEVSLESLLGDGIHVGHSLRSSAGKWNIKAARHGIYAGDTLALYAGTYSGTAAQGAFLHNDMGAALRMPVVTAASYWESDILDSLATTQLFDSVQSVWQGQFPHTVLMPDSTYQLTDTLGATVATVKVQDSIPEPFILLSNGKIQSDAILKIK